MRNPYEGVPLGEARHATEDSQTFRQPTAARTPAAHQDDGYEPDTSDQQDHRQERRNRRPKRSAREIYSEAQPYEPRDAIEQPRVTRRPNTTHVPGGGQGSDSETPVGEYYDPDRRPDEFANVIRNQDTIRGVFALAKLFACNSKRERYARLWVQPLMSSLSDRNMRLGDVLLPPGIKQRCLYLRVQGLFTLCKVILMQLSVGVQVK